MSRPTPRSSRRVVLGLALGVGAAVLGAAGCSSERSDGPEGSAGSGDPSARGKGASTREGAASAASTGGEDPDSALVALVVGDLSLAHARVRADRRAHPPLAEALRRFERLHARHAAELGGLVAVPAEAVAAEPRRRRVVADLTIAETRLQQRLADHAVAAGSGALALLLAQMAAAVSQELALL